MLCVLMTILSHARAKKEDRNAYGFQILKFYWLLSSDIAAVKGLRLIWMLGAQQRFSNNKNEMQGETISCCECNKSSVVKGLRLILMLGARQRFSNNDNEMQGETISCCECNKSAAVMQQKCRTFANIFACRKNKAKTDTLQKQLLHQNCLWLEQPHGRISVCKVDGGNLIPHLDSTLSAVPVFSVDIYARTWPKLT